MILAQHSFINCFNGNNEWPVFTLLTSEDTTDDCLKMTYVLWKSVEPFRDIQQKPSKTFYYLAVAF